MRCPHFNDVWQSMLLLFVCTGVASAQLGPAAQAAPREHTSEAETAAQEPTVEREQTSKSIVLANRALQPSTRRAWLGVVLSAAAGDGATIARVYPRSPAARSGLRRNDIVVGVNGKQIASVDQLIDLIRELKPDSKIELRVLRGDRELKVAATLEAISAAPRVWRRQAFRPPITQFDRPDATTWLADPLWDREMQIEQMLENLHREVDELREQVNTLKGDSAPSNLEADNPSQHENNPDSAQTGRRSAETPRRKYYQDYGRYYRFPPLSSRRSRNLYRLRPPRYYSYYPYAPPPYSGYRHEGRTYYYLAPEGPRFGARIGPYWFEYW